MTGAPFSRHLLRFYIGFATPDEKEELGADQERERAPEVIHLAPALAR